MTHDKSLVRRTLLTLLPKVAMSRITGWVTGWTLPRGLRPRLYGWFARRYGASLDEVEGSLDSFPSLAAFFSRPLVAGARPIDSADLVWPCDGRVVTSGPIEGDAIPQVKGSTYTLTELLGDSTSAERFRGGSQATIYLAPGDYHRVHAPFAGRCTALRSIRGTLFPVNPPAVQCIPKLFARNARRVFEFELTSGAAGAVVMVGALNVGSISVSTDVGSQVEHGNEVGRFGFGSTAIVLIGPDGPPIPSVEPETTVRMGRAAS